MTGRLVFLIMMVLVASTGAAEEQGSGAGRSTDGGDFALNFAAYEPIYFVAGWRGTTNAKFQLSFKYRFGDRFYGGYTQTSLWDLGSESAPFHDTSYRPALFYHDPNLATGLLGASRFGLQAGAEHESNGKAGADSRSINILFARPSLTYGGGEHNRLTIAPKIWWYVDKHENSDIDHYRGYAELLVAYEFRRGLGGHKFPEGLQTAATIRKGTERDYGSLQVDITYPFYIGYLDLQYFSGWGETMLDYNIQRPWQVRLGLMAIRW